MALAQTPQLLEKRIFNNKALSRNVNDLGQELRALERQGNIKKHQTQQGADSWRILPAVFQWWLVDELVRTVRSEKDFAQWIQAQEWGGLLTKEDEDQLIDAGKFLAGLIKSGVPEWIKFFSGE